MPMANVNDGIFVNVVTRQIQYCEQGLPGRHSCWRSPAGTGAAGTDREGKTGGGRVCSGEWEGVYAGIRQSVLFGLKDK